MKRRRKKSLRDRKRKLRNSGKLIKIRRLSSTSKNRDSLRHRDNLIERGNSSMRTKSNQKRWKIKI
jgi:hypothetical protein